MAIGALFTPPEGYYFETTRNNDGSYQIRTKSGKTYIFESVAGTVDQKAKLLKVVDRNQNILTLSYNGDGTLYRVTDDLNRYIEFAYVNSRISQITDWLGRQFQYGYNATGDLVTVSDPVVLAGNKNPVTYSYYTSSTLEHLMSGYTLPKGNDISYEYYADGRLFKQTTLSNAIITYRYDDFHRETVMINERGFTKKTYYDPNGNVTKIINENGGVTTTTYDETRYMNKVASVSASGMQTRYSYDNNGNATQLRLPSGNTIVKSYFNAFGQPGKVKDVNGNYTIYKYDNKGNTLEQISFASGYGASVDPNSYVVVPNQIKAWTINTYDQFGNVKTAKRVRDFSSGEGPTISYNYNDTVNSYLGLKPVTVTRSGDMNGDGTIETNENESASLVYDAYGRVTQGIDSNWYMTNFEYNAID